MYVPKSLGQVLGYNGSYDSGTCPHGWISRRAGSRDTGEVAPTGLYGLDDGFRLMLGILCCCLGQCDFLRFLLYLCHVIDDFACLDLQH